MKRKDNLRLPQVGQSVLLESRGLPLGSNPDKTYSFTIDCRGGAIVVYVPGHHRGPDNCTPSNPEQEAWLDRLTDLMRRSWGCQWDIHDYASLAAFVEMLEPMLERYHFVIE